jgi:hypothetical protein
VLTHLQRSGHCLWDQPVVLQRRQVHEPHAIWVFVQFRLSHPQPETRLADSARPGQREQSRSCELATDFCHFAPPTNEARQLDWKIVGRAWGHDWLGAPQSWTACIASRTSSSLTLR